MLIYEFVRRYRFPVQRVFFTSHQPKTATLVRHGIELHYDDDANEFSLAAETGVQVVLLNGVTLHV